MSFLSNYNATEGKNYTLSIKSIL